MAEVGAVTGRELRAVQAGPVPGLLAQLLLVSALARTVGLTGAGWGVGVTLAVIANAALARGLVRYRHDRLRPADWGDAWRGRRSASASPRWWPTRSSKTCRSCCSWR